VCIYIYKIIIYSTHKFEYILKYALLKIQHCCGTSWTHILLENSMAMLVH